MLSMIFTKYYDIPVLERKECETERESNKILPCKTLNNV